MKSLTNEQFEAFVENLTEESRQYNNGEISYPYIAGALQSLLRSATSSNENMRDIIVDTMLSNNV